MEWRSPYTIFKTMSYLEHIFKYLYNKINKNCKREIKNVNVNVNGLKKSMTIYLYTSYKMSQFL